MPNERRNSESTSTISIVLLVLHPHRAMDTASFFLSLVADAQKKKIDTPQYKRQAYVWQFKIILLDLNF
jgi:hypothetical protein